MSELAIETRGLTKSYAGVDAVRGIDLLVTRNTIFGFQYPVVQHASRDPVVVGYHRLDRWGHGTA